MSAGALLTPAEPWTFDHQPTYAAAQDWALAHLGPPDGRLLVVGSPPAEVLTLQAAGWAVTWLDWRPAPTLPDVEVVQGDTCALPADWTGRFAAVSSTCVWCHVGLGRYGDPVRADAPLACLREWRRVAGRLVAMLGPVTRDIPRIAPGHRVTTLARARLLLEAAGWTPTVWGRWHEPTATWAHPAEDASTDPSEPAQDYLCVAAR